MGFNSAFKGLKWLLVRWLDMKTGRRGIIGMRRNAKKKVDEKIKPKSK